MKLGFGLYRHQLTTDNFRFARQCGAEWLVVHLVDYFRGQGAADNQPVGDDAWGWAGDPHNPVWSEEFLAQLQEEAEKHGLKIWAIENFDPSMWYDILLDGPRKEEQVQLLQDVIRRLGRVGIPVMGYNFSIAGVAGRKIGPLARGHAETVFVDGPDERPIPEGMVWNMWYRERGAGHIPFFPHDELWRRLKWFLDRLVPVAEQAGVRLAAHPDDPPFPVLRQTPRLIYEPWMFQKLIDLHPSPANALEFCVGTAAEMQGEGDLYDVLDSCSRQGRIAYLHLRNVRGKIPSYQETFLDEGDVDVRKVLQILHRNNFDGVIIPDHTPLLSCAAPWHAGMAYAMGYIRAMLQALE